MDRTIIKADEDFDSRISFAEFKKMVKDLDVASKLQMTGVWYIIIQKKLNKMNVLNFNFFEKIQVIIQEMKLL